MNKITKKDREKISYTVNNPEKVINGNYICKYCGKKANYIFKNGVYCCSKYISQCSVIRKKCSEKEGRKKRGKNRKPIYIEDSNHICDYGCGQKAFYYFPSVDKWCCSFHHNQCSVKREFYSRSFRSLPTYGRSGKNHPFYGKSHSEKTKNKISESRKKYYKEHPKMKPVGKKNGMYGKKATKETRKKMRDSNHWKGDCLEGYIDVYGLAIGPWMYIGFIEKCKETKKEDWKEGKYDNRKSCHSKIEYKIKDGKTICLHSTWESELAKILDKNDVSWLRPCKENRCIFQWKDEDNEQHTYTPDFYLPDYNVYLDPHSITLEETYTEKNTIDKVKRVSKQNDIKVILILDKKELNWKSIQKLIEA